MKLVTAKQMQEIDRRTIDGGLVPALELMENAGHATAREASQLLADPRGARVEIVCGKGNNAGDGLVVARLLAAAGAEVCVHMTHPAAELSPDARENFARLPSGVEAMQVPDSLPDPGATDSPLARPRLDAGPMAMSAPGDACARLAHHLRGADLCVDALLGTGVERRLTGRLASLVNWINRCSVRTLSVDVPSGIDATSGEVLGTAVWADLTVTFGLPKLGLALHPGRERAGRLVVAEIGFPDSVVEQTHSVWSWVDAECARSLLPRLAPDAHKYSRGCVVVIAGSRGFPGAAALAAEAALRAGAGMVHLVAPRSIHDILETQLREVIVHPAPEDESGSAAAPTLELIEPLLPRADAVAIGPGVGGAASTRAWIGDLLKKLPCPAVVDADAVLALPEPPHPAPRLVTPHAGELSRWLGVAGAKVAEAYIDIAADTARQRDAVVVAKGAPTVVLSPAGERRVNGSGNPGLATAGSGDVLTGLIGALVAQGLAATDAASLGVFLHGRAADLASRDSSPRSLVAGDILRFIGRAYASLEA
ncbi:MAG: NAD(P)H-hydrate dehydratase [Candidatus Latescibacterota bacterium]|nr:MAG: NAD(P)H-hydrate dehydratase [Candidatus Latescibacterota bacterium]